MHTTHTRRNLIRCTITLVVTVVLAAMLPTLAADPATAAEIGPITVNCGRGGSPVVAVTGTVGDTITVTRSGEGDCSHTSSTPGIVAWTATALNAVGMQNPNYTWATTEPGNPWGTGATITITLLQEGTTRWRAWQRSDGIYLDIRVLPAQVAEPLEIQSLGELVVGTEGEPYQASIGALGGTAPYAWSVASGALPPGLSVAPDGAVTGTPAAAGTYAFTARVSDAAGAQADVDLEIVIEPAAVNAENLPICHATADGYDLVMTTEDVFDGKGAHGDHAGDIVPDLLASGRGRNWNATGVATFFNGCQAASMALLDTDSDGIPDEYDADDDGDGIADVADADEDGDGIPNRQDLNDGPASDQDADGIPDALDNDDDGDCIADAQDADRDGDGIPDSVDPDLDNDGTPNANDLDEDGDGIPNLLDLDADGSGVADAEQRSIPTRSKPSANTCSAAKDLDADGIPDTKDTDDDGDGIPDTMDRIVSRPWVDTDADGIPNVKDPDIDDDGAPNAMDSDADGDGVVDTRDKDANADGIVETRDNPLTEPFTLPAISAGEPVTLAEGSLLTKSGRKAVIDVTCSSVSTSRAKPAGDIGVPDAKGRCLVFKAGDRLRLFVFEGKPTRVTVRITTPAVDDFRPAKEVVTTTVR